jgi:superfamily II DNA helicase RecQ
VELSLADIKNADIVIGTSCCGTGIDLDSVRHVIVCGLPYSVEQLLQWAGRCRSDGLVTVILANAHMLQETELSGET